MIGKQTGIDKNCFPLNKMVEKEGDYPYASVEHRRYYDGSNTMHLSFFATFFVGVFHYLKIIKKTKEQSQFLTDASSVNLCN